MVKSPFGDKGSSGAMIASHLVDLLIKPLVRGIEAFDTWLQELLL